jgi:hypothetical protein
VSRGGAAAMPEGVRVASPWQPVQLVAGVAPWVVSGSWRAPPHPQDVSATAVSAAIEAGERIDEPPA